MSIQWRQNGRDSVSNHQPHDCLLNRLFRRRSKKTSKLRVTGRCVWTSPDTTEFLAQMASSAENVSIWRRHHGSWSMVVKYLPDYTNGFCVFNITHIHNEYFLQTTAYCIPLFFLWPCVTEPHTPVFRDNRWQCQGLDIYARADYVFRNVKCIIASRKHEYVYQLMYMSQ